MKKTFVAVVLCMALLSSFTVFASAYDVNDIYNQVTAIRNELGYPQGNWSSLRRAVNYIADNLPKSSDYSTVLSNIKTNSDSLVSYIKLIEGDTNNISARATDLLNKLSDVYLRQGQMQVAITNHIDSASAQNHTDLTSFNSDFSNAFSTVYTFGDSPSSLKPYYFTNPDGEESSFTLTWSYLVSCLFGAFTRDGLLKVSSPSGVSYSRTFYSLIHQLQEVLASDDDLQLKKDNKDNEDAATDAFVNGSSSKTSLGTGDIGNLKDVGGTFNDLTSLNGQSSVSSFLSGLTSADGTGQGWFSEATRASLDAVSAPVTTTKLVQKHWRGEKSLVYSISADTSLNVVSSPAPARAPAADPDPYNMSGFDANYNWLWGDAS